MDNKDHAVKNLPRAERIREEARRALEFGYTPKAAISLDSAFRVEGLVATAPPSPDLPGARFLDNVRMEIMTSRDAIPATLQHIDSADVLTAQIEAQLSRMTPGETAERTDTVLETLARLQQADPHRGATASLRGKVASALFGDSYLKSEQNLSGASTTALGGNAGGTDDGRK